MSDDTPRNDPKHDSEAERDALNGDSSEIEANAEPGAEDSLEELRQEAAENYERYVRAVADLDNHRRRAAKEKKDARLEGLSSVLKELLPVLDSFSKALDGGEDQSAAADFVSGMQLVHKQLREALERNGLEAVEAVGASFDPNVHQAIQRIESTEVSEDTVQEEYSRGYTVEGRLLRPAMVSVAVPAAEAKPTS